MHGKLKHFKIVSAFFPMHRRQSKLMPVFLSLQELELLAHIFFVKKDAWHKVLVTSKKTFCQQFNIVSNCELNSKYYYSLCELHVLVFLIQKIYFRIGVMVYKSFTDTTREGMCISRTKLLFM